MITIGLRCSPSEVTFAIYDSASSAVVNVESIVVPIAYGWPERLKHVRSNLLDVLREYGVMRAGVRLAEPMAKAVNIDRTHIEGVVQEAFASSDLQGYYVGAIATIAARIGVDRNLVKEIVAGKNTLEIDNWGALTANEREAVLTAVGASRV